MSVTGVSYNINAIAKLSESELKQCVADDQSWHNQYKDSCYIFVGGLPYHMNEGDTVAVFSQWGELVDVHLVRDKHTGAFKGYGFIGYENQKSTILAVDNFNGYELLGRRLRVDHCRSFRAPKLPQCKGEHKEEEEEYTPTGAEGVGFGVCGVVPSVQNTLRSHQGSRSIVDTTSKVFADTDEQWAYEFEAHIKRVEDQPCTTHVDSQTRQNRHAENDTKVTNPLREIRTSSSTVSRSAYAPRGDLPGQQSPYRSRFSRDTRHSNRPVNKPTPGRDAVKSRSLYDVCRSRSCSWESRSTRASLVKKSLPTPSSQHDPSTVGKLRSPIQRSARTFHEKQRNTSPPQRRYGSQERTKPRFHESPSFIQSRPR